MRKHFSMVTGTAFFILLFSRAAAGFNIPERLEYDIRWLGIKAGTSSLEIAMPEEGRIRIISRAKSVDWVSVFYPVDDWAQSLVGVGSEWYPINYRLKTREGRRRKDREVVFYTSQGRAEYTNHLKREKVMHDLPERIYDPLSAFYVMRRSDLVVNTSSFVPMFDSKRVWDVEVKVLRKESVTVPAGTFDTIVIKPLMQSEGFFSRAGDLYIWLTDDEKRIPVKLKTKVKIGSVSAELTGGSY